MTGHAATGGSQPPDPQIIEIYRMAVEMADRVSPRRAAANAFFLTVNTALVAVVGLHDPGSPSSLLPVAVCIAGVSVALCWWLLLGNYRKLNEAKFLVINRIESEYLPVAPFKEEWEILGGQGIAVGRLSRIRHALKQLGHVERFVPLVFGLLYLMLLIGTLST